MEPRVRGGGEEGDYKLMMTAWEIFPNISFTQPENLIRIKVFSLCVLTGFLAV